MIYTRKVQRIVEHVFADGYVRPVLVLNKPFLVKQDDCHTIILEGVRALYNQKIGRGSTIKFEVEETDVNIIKSFGGEIVKRNHLERCNVCRHQVIYDALHELHRCTNPYCHGKSRSSILRLVELSLLAFGYERKNIALAVKLFEGKLDKYPTRDGKVILRDINTFLMVFESLGEKNTATRTGHWQTVSGSLEASLEVHKIEVCIQEYLRSGKIFESSSALWTILNIPQLSHRYFEFLPVEINEDFYSQVKAFTMPKPFKTVIRKNSDYITRTTNSLKSFITK